jgi:sulfur-oxidizing protein SoxB
VSSRRITIVQQNDTHGYLWPHPELFWSAPRPSFKSGIGGFAKTAAWVRAQRQQEPVLLVDGGDTFHGTGPVVLSSGAIVPPLLKALGVDVMVPGNWDFAYGPDQLTHLIHESGNIAIAANVFQASQHFLPSSTVVDVCGVQVGLIGLTYAEETEVMPKNFVRHLTFDLNLSQLTDLVHQLRERADVVVLVSHLGLPQDLAVAHTVPGIHIILSGHSHDRLQRVMMVNQTWIIQSGANGSFVGALSFSIDSGKRLREVRHRLIPLDETITPAPDVADMLERALLPYREVLAEPIGQLGTPVHRMTVLQAPMDQIITDAYLAYTGADIAFSHGWRYGAPILPGPVTVQDLYGMLPTNPELFDTEVDGQMLHDFLEQNLESVFAANPFDQKGGFVVRSSGLLMAFKPYNPKGHRIEYLAVHNQEVQRARRYTVVSAGAQALKGLSVSKRSLNVLAHDVLREYFRRHQPVIVPDSSHVVAL